MNAAFDRGSSARPAGGPDLRLAVAAFVCVPFGVVLVAIADQAGRSGATWAVPVFWAGLATVFAPAAALVWSGRLSRGETLTLILAVGLGLYAANRLATPGVLAEYDELLHFRTLDDIARTGRLFAQNPLLPISPYYPGLEIVTHALMSATGLGEIAAGTVVIAAARALLLLSLVLFLERTSLPAQLAGMGVLLYMTASSFYSFDAVYAYESLALPLAALCLFLLREAQARQGAVRRLLNVSGAFLALAVVATHHVTSFVLAAALVGWTVTTLLTRRGGRDPLPGGGWVTVLLTAAIVVWVGGVATATVGYLAPHASGAWREVLKIIAGEGLGRRLFESAGGVTTPLFERAVGIASVLLVLAGLPFGAAYVRRHQGSEALARFLMLSALAYPAVLALRFTRSGWEIGSRGMAFMGVPIAFLLAAGLEQLRRSGRPRSWLSPLVTAAVVVVFAGGVIAGTSPVNRMARPYHPGSYSASIEGEGLAAADWARTTLGSGKRMIGDSTNASLMGSYGRQRILSSGDGLSISGFYLEPFGRYQEEMIAEHDVEYAVVDRRIAGIRPLAGFFFEKWERDIADYGAAIDPNRLSRYDRIRDVDRVYDSGNIQLYDVRRIGR